MRERELVLLLAVWLGAAGCVASHPPAHLFGVRLGMPKGDVDRLLDQDHRLVKDESGPGGAKEVWDLEDPTFQSLAVAYDPDLRVKYVTAHARPDGKPMRYRDLGKLENAILTGQYFYTWNVPAHEGAYAVVARGTDPRYLFSVSLYLPLTAPPEATPKGSSGAGGSAPRPRAR